MPNYSSREAHPRFIDLVGSRFGSWLVLSLADRAPSGPLRWLCRCDCGLEARVIGGNLRGGNSKSCRPCAKTTHGLSRSRVYETWRNMLSRCGQPSCERYPRYGGRGISVCRQWLSFDVFYADMGPQPDGKSIERIDNDGDYTPENCRWATHDEQMQNVGHVKFLEWNGERLTRSQWADRVGLHRETIRSRLKRGWTVERALTTPTQK